VSSPTATEPDVIVIPSRLFPAVIGGTDYSVLRRRIAATMQVSLNTADTSASNAQEGE